MARWQIGDAIDALQFNAFDRRQYGVFDYSEVEHAPDEGPCSVTVGSSGDEVLFDIDPGDVQVDGTTVETPSQSVEADSNPSSDEWRKDAITIDSAGDAQIWKGEPAELLTYTDSNDDEHDLAPRKSPVPEPPDLRDHEGTLLAVVSIPPGASNTSDVDQDNIHDRRREAIDVSGERNLQYESIPWTSLEGGGGDNSTAGKPLILPPDATLEVWHWGTCWQDEWGSSDPDAEHQLRLLDENKEVLETTGAFWESGENSEPLFSVSNDGDTEPLAYQFQIRNNSSEDFTWQNDMRGIGANIYFRILL